MTAVTGHKCDICGKFDTEDRVGWMELKIHGTRPNDGFPDICSNRCLANLAIERVRELDGEAYAAPKGRGSDKGKRTYLSEEERTLCLVRAAEVGQAEAAREFGVSPSTIRNWVKQGAA
jgi:hypothetical protein